MTIPSISLAVRASPITSDNKSTAVTIATWILMVTFIIMFLSREAVKFVVIRRFAIDDLLILLATMFAIGLSAAALVLANEGLGENGQLTLRRANALMKGYYASDFLYILSICFAKLSLVIFFYRIVVQRSQRLFVLGFGIFIISWTLASLFAVAFQCGLPRPWEMMTLHCYNSGIFWITYCIIDMTTDVSIIMLSVNLVAYVQIKFSSKAKVVACFLPRILVMGAALARLVYLYPITPHDNPAFNLWVPVVCTQVQICLAISTACIPYMKPFFDGLENWRPNEMRRRSMTLNDLYGYASPSSDFRGHRRGKEFISMDSTATTSLRYGRTPDVSPRIPSPAPLSPLTPPRLITPPNASVNTSRSPSERGLRLHIPPPELQVPKASDVASPQTASSHALSPQCISPQPLLSPPPFSPTRREPTPPPRSHSPRPQVSSSAYGSPDPNAPSPSRSPNFSLFPQQRRARYSLIPQDHPIPPPTIPPVVTPRSRSASRQQNRISVHRMSPNTSATRGPTPNTKFPPRTSSIPQNPKYSTTPHPASPPTSTTNTATSSPPTVPSYYFTTPPTSNPPTFPLPTPPNQSPQRIRNQRILAPQNSSRREQMSPVSPASPPTPLTFWREDTSSESAGASASAGTWRAQRPWEDEPMPVVRDVRSSPRIVVQSFQ